MHFQSILTLSIALLAGTSVAADYNGNGKPFVLRKGRTKLGASDLLSGSSSASVATPLPTPSFSASTFPSPSPSASASASASAFTSMLSSIARPSSSALASSSASFTSSTRPGVQSSSAHGPAAQETHAVHPSAASGAKGHSADDTSVPVSDLYEGTVADTPSHKPFWSKPIKDTQGKPRPNAPDFSDAPDASINSKEGCSVRCNDWVNECAGLLQHNADFCWQQFPSCQDLCVKEHAA